MECEKVGGISGWKSFWRILGLVTPVTTRSYKHRVCVRVCVR